jgi:hypothetical protein
VGGSVGQREYMVDDDFYFAALQTCARRSRAMAAFSSTLRGRKVEPVSADQRDIISIRLEQGAASDESE